MDEALHKLCLKRDLSSKLVKATKAQDQNSEYGDKI